MPAGWNLEDLLGTEKMFRTSMDEPMEGKKMAEYTHHIFLVFVRVGL